MTILIPLPARRSAKTRSHSESGTTSLTSGSSSIAFSSTSLIARRHERGVEAKPEVMTSSFWKSRSSGTSTSLPKTPIWTYRAPRSAASKAVRAPPAAPEHSMTTLADCGSACVAVSNPSSRAASSRATSEARPTTVTSAPERRATCAARSPTGPGPVTRTGRRRRRAAGRRGSGRRMRAARRGMRRGRRASRARGCRFCTGTITKGAKAPSTNEPIERRSGQRLGRPSRHHAQTRQVE